MQDLITGTVAKKGGHDSHGGRWALIHFSSWKPQARR